MPLRPAFVLFAILALCAASCSSLGTDGSGTRPDADAELAQFLHEADEAWVARSPSSAAYRGRKANNDRWDDLSEAHAAEGEALAQRQLAELHARFDLDTLDTQDRLSFRLFEYDAERRIRDYRWRHHTYPLNHHRGWHTSVPSFLMNMHSVDDVSDAEAYISRLHGVTPLFEQLVRQLEVRRDLGVIPPRFVFARVREASRNVITGAPFDDGSENVLLADFRAKVDALDLPDARKERLVERAADALATSVGPAYERMLAAWDELELSATDDDGAWKFPDGEAYYAYRLALMTTTDLDARQIHELGLAEVDRIHAEMRAIMDAVGFEGDLAAFFDFMRTDERFYFPNNDEGRQAYLDRANQVIAEISARLDELFITLPDAELEVRRVEPYRERSAGKAFYQSGSADGERPGVYYANLFDMGDMPTYQLRALAYHEAIPGHHMQSAINQQLDDLPAFRRYTWFTAHGEGWGLYSEYVPKEIGLYADPYEDFGRLAMELWRACRLVVDTGLHDERWTRRQAIDYLLTNTPNPEGDAIKAIERYIVMPGQATAYMVGKLRIMELRAEARERLGDAFDVRAFHEVVIGYGNVPLQVLAENVDAWVRGVQQGERS